MLQKTDGAKRKGKSRKTRNIGYTGQIKVREYRRGNKKRTTQRNRQHRIYKTQDKKVRDYRWDKKRAIQRNWQNWVNKTQDQYMLDNTEEVMIKDNPEKLATQGTQDTGHIHVREHQRGNQNGQYRETGYIGDTRHRTNKRQRISKGH